MPIEFEPKSAARSDGLPLTTLDIGGNRMKRVGTMFGLALALFVAMSSFTAGSLNASGIDSDIAMYKSCQHCGMDREKFAQSRMLIEYDDGTTVASCSLHCTAVDLANNIDKTPKTIKVADFGSKELINAEKAVWVIGGSKQGVMTRNAKWAFNSRDNAAAFIKENGGTLADFEGAIKTAYEDMYNDTRMIRDKRKQMKMKKGVQNNNQGGSK
jgi:copper chaperone NosL